MPMEHVVVVGGGVLGTMHAVAACRRGMSVTHLEADPEPQGATVRNFGFLQVSVRAPGPELETAIRGRSIWAELGNHIPGIGFRPDGSIIVLSQPEEMEFARKVIEREDFTKRGLNLLNADEVHNINPTLNGHYLGGLHSSIDAVVEPRTALPAIRDWLASSGSYRFHSSTVVVDLRASGVTDQRGAQHSGDHVILCPGAVSHGLTATLLERQAQYPVYLQMFQTDPFPSRLTTAVAGGDVMRDYPGFDLPGRATLPALPEVALRFDSHLLVTQRAGGELTIGDTHHSGLPLPFDIDETPFEYLKARVETILGTELPTIRRRWSGVYGRLPTGDLCLRRQIHDRATLVTGLGGRGMTISPAVAETTFEILLGEETK